ncbi:MAG: cupin domain-containing protein [Dehalococcoidia bacterium]
MTATTHTYLRNHRLSAAALSFALPAEEAPLRERALASSAGRAAKTLVKEGTLRITLIALRKGVVLRAHQVEGAASIHVVRGRARVSAAGTDSELSAGGIVVLQEQVPHTAAALTDCTLLVTVAMRVAT